MLFRSHTDGVIEDVCRRDHSKELEVGEVETVTKLEVSWLRPLHTGPSCIKDRLLLRITRGVKEGQTRMTVFRRVATRDGLEGVLDEHGGFTVNTRSLRRRGGRHWDDSREWSLLKNAPLY